MDMAAPRPQQAFRPSLPVAPEDALRAMLAGLEPVAGRWTDLTEAEGLCLAQDLVAPGPTPSQPTALRDGVAVGASDTAGATPYSPALLASEPLPVRLGQALPPGRDAVLPADAVAGHAGIWEAYEEAAPGAWARRVGEDLGQGAVLRVAGEFVSAIDVAIASAAGLEQCVIRQPAVAMVFRDPSSPAAQLAARLASLSGAAIRVVKPGSRPDPDIQLVLTTEPLHDILPPVRRDGGEVVARSLALRPAEEAQLGKAGPVRVLSAPDRIADWLAVSLAIARPCLRQWTGARLPAPEARPLMRKITSTIGLTEIVLLRRTAEEYEPLATGDLPLSAIAAADTWIMIPPESEGLPAGQTVSANPILPR